ncbi:MAG: hypothetical protein LWX83_16815 [Anaerolineae bacterium]|nr:hypothetical protein [Anaerolineae bacterium]
MQDASAGPKSGEGMWLWLAKIVSGGLIFFFLLLHFVVNHLVAIGGLLKWADVVQYYLNPVIPVVEGLFLIFVVSHALMGLRSVILDLKPTRALLKVLDGLFVIIGIVAVVYGIWLINAIVAHGRVL